jgi:hypothetical protein
MFDVGAAGGYCGMRLCAVVGRVSVWLFWRLFGMMLMVGY